MRTKQHWMLPAPEKARLGPFFAQIWRLVNSYGHPPEAGGPDDDLYWQSLIEAAGRIGQQCDADHSPWAARFLIAMLEAAGDLQRLQDPGGGADRPGGLEDAAAS